MRTALHTALAFEPVRTASRGAIRQAVQTPVPVTSGLFSRMLQTISQQPGSSATQTASPSTAAAPAATTAPAAQTAPSSAVAASTATPAPDPGVMALVNAIMNGTLQVSYVTDPSKLKETTPAGADTMPNFYYASDQTANQIAQLLGGTVVQKTAFGQAPGFTEPLANFIQLPNGMTVNAADLAYYGRCGVQGAAQLTADLTQTINEGAAWSNWYQYGGQIPSFPMGYVGPPISGMTYPAGSVGSDGNVINPAMQNTKTST